MKIQVTSLATLALLLSGVALGMPSEEELDDAKPVVEDLMKPDMDAMKLGKKSRSDVAKSAMELCDQAESTAAKMMLARNAFTLYMRDTDYASAEEALDALIDGDFIPGEAPFEIVVEFTMPVGPVERACVFGSVGGKVNGIMPFFIIRSTLYAYMSASGAAWDISPGTPTSIQLMPTGTYRIKCAWDGKEYTWSEWRGGWVVVKRLQNKTPVFGGTKLQLGTCRGLRLPFNGTIDLNKCYIKVGGKLWWEGVKGAGRALR